jgi:S1-C subfamily serine protease
LTAILVLSGLLLWTWIKRPKDPRDPSVEARAVTARGDLAEDEKSTIRIFEEASPSVVHVANVAVRRRPYSYSTTEFEQGTGTGLIWSRDGFIVTNFHVVKGGQRFIVTLYDQTAFEAVPVGGSRAHDLAVLRIDGPPDRLKPIAIGTSHDLKIGQKVFAIGNPFGLDQTLSTGVVSQLNRVITTSEQIPIRGVIQTDAAINPGNSGGPLLDSAGRLIGVNTAIISPSGGSSGIGFAVPVDVVNSVVSQIIAKGSLQQPSIKATLVNDDTAARWRSQTRIPEGVLIQEVDPGGPAEVAGLRGLRSEWGRILLGDVVTRVGDKDVRSESEFKAALAEMKIGQRIDLTIIRKGQEMVLSVTLGAEE